MRIEIELTDREPPAGNVRDGDRDLPFVGWLGLLRVLAEVIGPTEVEVDRLG